MFIVVSDGAFAIADKTVIPKSVNDMKLIHAGKVLENNKTLAESRIFFGEFPGGVITMHVVVQPPLAKKKTGLLTLSSLISVNHYFVKPILFLFLFLSFGNLPDSSCSFHVLVKF